MPRLRKIELDDLFRLRAVGRSAISPDGRRVAFELKRSDLAENKNFVQLMLADVERSDVRELTRGKHCDVRPTWSPDGSMLAFLSDRDKGQCIFLLPMTGGDARRITEPDGFAKDLAWSPDGRRIVYTWQAMSERERLERDGKHDEVKKRPQFKHITRLHHKLDGAGWWNGHYTHVRLLDLDPPEKRRRPRQLTSGDFDHSEPRFSPNGRLISFVSNRSKDPDLHYDQADVFVVKPSGGTPKRITLMPGSCAGHSWSPDGKTIAFVGNAAPTGEWWKHNERVWLVPSGGGKPRELATQIDNNCRNLTLGDVTSAGFEVASVIWAPDGSRVYFLVSERGACRLYSHSTRGDDFYCEVVGEVNIYSIQRTGRDGPIALSLGTTTDPGDVYIAEEVDPKLGGEKSFGWAPMNRGKQDLPRRLSHVNSQVLDELDLPAPEEIIVKNGGIRVQAWVFKPPGFDGKRKYPAILEIHGGPHTQVGYSFFHEKQWLAARGYVLVSANPRGSTGYGLNHAKAIHAAWGTKDYKDLMKVADWLFSRPYVDRRRVGVTGGSYGGYMTNWIAGHTERFRAAVTQRSVVNLESMFGTSDFGYDLGHEFGGLPWEKRGVYRNQSPLTFVQNIRTPLLIEHEEEDHRCPIEQAEQLFASLRVLGRTTELVRFEGESHGLCRGGRPQNRAERLRRIVGWFDRHMK